MTFIASVIAREGVAIVADSFRTTIEHSLDEQTFLDYIDSAKNKTNIPIKELISLFDERASHTRNYVDKLHKFDADSAIASAGAAYINGKEIKDIINSISAEMRSDKNAYDAMSIEDKLKEFCEKMKVEVFEHLKKFNMSETDFIFSHFNRAKNEPKVFRIVVKKIDKQNYDEKDPSLVSFEERTSYGLSLTVKTHLSTGLFSAPSIQT